MTTLQTTPSPSLSPPEQEPRFAPSSQSPQPLLVATAQSPQPLLVATAQAGAQVPGADDN